MNSTDAVATERADRRAGVKVPRFVGAALWKGVENTQNRNLVSSDLARTLLSLQLERSIADVNGLREGIEDAIGQRSHGADASCGCQRARTAPGGKTLGAFVVPAET